MFYGFHHFLNKYNNVSINEFDLNQSRIRRLFFIYIEKNMRSLLKLPLYWSFIVTKKHLTELKESDYAIFSSNRIGCSALPMVIYLKLKKQKIITLSFVLGLFSRKPKFKIFIPIQSWYIKSFFKYIDKFIFLSQGEYEYALKHFPKYKNKYFLLPFAVDLEIWSNKENFQREKNILFVGNDGFRDYELAEELSKLLEDFNFVYVSENINESNLNNKNSDIKNGSWGEPYLTDIDLRGEYQKAFLTIIPLKNSLQPSGQSVTLQSIACGTPVLITKTEGFWDKESFIDNENIHFLKTNNPLLWKDKILNIFNMSDQDYENVSKNGRNLIVNNYSLDEFSQQIEEILLS